MVNTKSPTKDDAPGPRLPLPFARSAPFRKIWHLPSRKSLKNHANRVFWGATNEARAEDYQRPRAESMGDAVALPTGLPAAGDGTARGSNAAL